MANGESFFFPFRLFFVLCSVERNWPGRVLFLTTYFFFTNGQNFLKALGPLALARDPGVNLLSQIVHTLPVLGTMVLLQSFALE